MHVVCMHVGPPFAKSNFKQQLGCRFDIIDNESYFFVFWHMQLHMSWYIRSFFGLTFLNILYFFKYSYTNIFHIRGLYTFYSNVGRRCICEGSIAWPSRPNPFHSRSDPGQSIISYHSRALSPDLGGLVQCHKMSLWDWQSFYWRLGAQIKRLQYQLCWIRTQRVRIRYKLHIVLYIVWYSTNVWLTY